MSRPRFRRHFLWDTVQPRFLGLSFCYVVVVIVAVSAALFLPLMLQLEHLPVSSPEAQRVADQFELLHSRFWPVVAVVSLLLLVHGVFFSHRIAGPLTSMRKRNVWVKWSARCGRRSPVSKPTMPTSLRNWSD